MRRAYGLGDYELARELKRQGGDIISQRLPRLVAVLRVFVMCKIAEWVVRASKPCAILMSQSMILRRYSASCVSMRGWLKFEESYRKMPSARSMEIGKKEEVSGANRNKVFAKKYARLLSFRGRGRASGVKKSQGKLEYRIGAPTRRRFLSIECLWLYRYESREIGQF